MRLASSELPFFLVVVLLLFPITCIAQKEKRTPAEESVRKVLQNYLGPRDENQTTGYADAYVDLNDDGKKEVIVYVVGRGWCGSGGCPTLVLAPEDSSYRLVTKISITRPPIRVLTRKTRGWHGLSVWVQGGGVQPGYEAELLFDGKTYPQNPSVPPAKRLAGKVAAQIVIPASVNNIKNAKPLYP